MTEWSVAVWIQMGTLADMPVVLISFKALVMLAPPVAKMTRPAWPP